MGEIYKIVIWVFSTQFSLLYLPMKYLTIIIFPDNPYTLLPAGEFPNIFQNYVIQEYQVHKLKSAVF